MGGFRGNMTIEAISQDPTEAIQGLSVELSAKWESTRRKGRLYYSTHNLQSMNARECRETMGILLWVEKTLIAVKLHTINVALLPGLLQIGR